MESTTKKIPERTAVKNMLNQIRQEIGETKKLSDDIEGFIGNVSGSEKKTSTVAPSVKENRANKAPRAPKKKQQTQRKSTAPNVTKNVIVDLTKKTVPCAKTKTPPDDSGPEKKIRKSLDSGRSSKTPVATTKKTISEPQKTKKIRGDAKEKKKVTVQTPKKKDSQAAAVIQREKKSDARPIKSKQPACDDEKSNIVSDEDAARENKKKNTITKQSQSTVKPQEQKKKVVKPQEQKKKVVKPQEQKKNVVKPQEQKKKNVAPVSKKRKQAPRSETTKSSQPVGTKIKKSSGVAVPEENKKKKKKTIARSDKKRKPAAPACIDDDIVDVIRDENPKAMKKPRLAKKRDDPAHDEFDALSLAEKFRRYLLMIAVTGGEPGWKSEDAHDRQLMKYMAHQRKNLGRDFGTFLDQQGEGPNKVLHNFIASLGSTVSNFDAKQAQSRVECFFEKDAIRKNDAWNVEITSTYEDDDGSIAISQIIRTMHAKWVKLLHNWFMVATQDKTILGQIEDRLLGEKDHLSVQERGTAIYHDAEFCETVFKKYKAAYQTIATYIQGGVGDRVDPEWFE